MQESITWMFDLGDMLSSCLVSSSMHVVKLHFIKIASINSICKITYDIMLDVVYVAIFSMNSGIICIKI